MPTTIKRAGANFLRSPTCRATTGRVAAESVDSEFEHSPCLVTFSFHPEACCSEFWYDRRWLLKRQKILSLLACYRHLHALIVPKFPFIIVRKSKKL